MRGHRSTRDGQITTTTREKNTGLKTALVFVPFLVLLLSLFNLGSLIWRICTSGGCQRSQVNTATREAKEKKGRDNQITTTTQVNKLASKRPWSLWSVTLFNLVSLIWCICTSGGCERSQVNTARREAKEKKKRDNQITTTTRVNKLASKRP